MKDCNSCKHFWYDNSTGTSECGQYDNMTEDETDKYYTNGEGNCPFYNEKFECVSQTYLEALIAKYEGYTKLNEEKPLETNSYENGANNALLAVIADLKEMISRS